MTIVRFLVLLLLLSPTQVVSQGIQFVVDWTIPENPIDQKSQLKAFKDSGISFVQIEGVIDLSIVDLIQSQELELWISSGVKFLRPSDFSEQQNLIDSLTDPLFYYRNHEVAIARYTLFEHPLLTDDFKINLPTYISNVREVYSGDIDIISNAGFTDFKYDIKQGLTVSSLDAITVNTPDIERIEYIKVLNSAFTPNSARKLRELLSLERYKETYWMFEFDIIKQLDSNPELAKVIKGFANNKNAVLTLGPQVPEEDSLVIITITILILITLFIAIFTTNASYQRMFVRYLMTHNFFINDVMMRRSRFTGAIPIAWLLSLLFGLLLFWITIDATFNDLTVNMLAYHHPGFISIFASGTASTVFFLTIGLFSFQGISLLWITLANFNKVSISQIIQILLMPYQLIIPITIVASLFYLNSDSTFLIIATLALSLFIWVLSVPITCIDILSQSQGKKTLTWIFGPLLYVITIVGVTVYILKYTTIPDTFSLILSLV